MMHELINVHAAHAFAHPPGSLGEMLGSCSYVLLECGLSVPVGGQSSVGICFISAQKHGISIMIIRSVSLCTCK